ncbi:unnamed protein product [Leptidea sinapis]|uniref:Uncharacterized protein n=1 Tax=Leptidea sinapis TaxID=189913 RepID=A0A5E4QIR2_9NEOP|nr:unnamed protein product [Leptidea sinapis]
MVFVPSTLTNDFDIDHIECTGKDKIVCDIISQTVITTENSPLTQSWTFASRDVCQKFFFGEVDRNLFGRIS